MNAPGRPAITGRASTHENASTPQAGAHRASTSPQGTWRWPLAAALIVFAVYVPLAFFEFGFSDDYRILAAADRGGTLANLSLSEGRPIFALWLRYVLERFRSIDQLAIVRVISAAGIALVAAVVTRVWQAASGRSADAAAVGIAAATLPAFQLYASWATSAPVPYTVAVACTASIICGRAVNDANRARRARMLCGSAALLTLSLATYQTAGMFFFVAGAVQVLQGGQSRSAFRRLTAAHAVVGGVSLAIAFAIFKIASTTVVSPVTGTVRAELAGDFAAKLAWFLVDVLPQSLNLWNLRTSPALGATVLTLILSGLWLHVRGTEDAALKMTTAVVLIPVVYLPSLMTAESWPSYRSQTALVVLLLVYAVISLAAHARWWNLDARPIAPIALAATGTAAALWGTLSCFAIPQSRELSILRSRLAGETFSGSTILVKPATRAESLAPLVRHDEFGYPSSATLWGAAALPYLILRELHPSRDTTTLRVVLSGRATSDRVTIDLQRALRDAAANGDRR